MTTVIVSYDGTDNDRDALAFGRLLGQAGASLELAYVRHAQESEGARERLAENDATALLDEGATSLGEDVQRHVVMSGSTPEGLRDLALRIDAGMIVFGSEYRTAKGHVDPQASARRLIEGGPVAVGLAPAGFYEVDGYSVTTIGAASAGGDPSVHETAESLARSLGANLAQRATSKVDLMVVGSRAGTATGRVALSGAAEYLIELALCPVVVLPRGVALTFG